MTVRIDISPEEQDAYKAEALREGLSVEAWLKKLANERARPESKPGIQGKALLEACEKVRGVLTDDEVDVLFSRNRSIARPLNL
ncbi:MAG: hypothetical protein H6509_06950 [Bryobacterales bacterium]|nr:hypothetical protein [Acidobacteriota bacterium]MCB9384335.1 hypothetical protein [Bryobacterales bacterium]